MQEAGFVNVSAIMQASIYALVHKGVVVYIGKSTKPGLRLVQHMENRDAKASAALYNKARIRSPFVFDAVWVMPCAISDLYRLEIDLIKKYNPKYNTNHKTGPKLDLGALLKITPKVQVAIERRV